MRGTEGPAGTYPDPPPIRQTSLPPSEAQGLRPFSRAPHVTCPSSEPQQYEQQHKQQGTPRSQGAAACFAHMAMYKPSAQVSDLRPRKHWEEAEPGCNPSLLDPAISSQHCRPDQGPSDHTLQGPGAHRCPWSLSQTSQALLTPSASPGIN